MKKITSTDNNFRNLLITTTILLFVLITIGGILRVSGPDASCPDWPTCNNSWLPPFGDPAMLGYTHRLIALAAGLLVLASASRSVLKFRKKQILVNPLIGAAALIFTEIVLGGRLATLEMIGLPTALHLAGALTILGLVLFVTVLAFASISDEKLTYNSSFARWSLVTFILTFLLLVSGAIVTAAGAGAVCSSWPLCNGTALPKTTLEWIATLHRIVVAGTGAILAGLFLRAWKAQRSHTSVLVATTAASVLFVSQALLGSAKITWGNPGFMIVLHEATAVAFWMTMVIQVVLVGLAARTTEEERAEAIEARSRIKLFPAFLALTKPIVVLLLLVTTYAGMVIGAGEWPSLATTFWVMLGGFMAAGGSGAINQFIDRYDDNKMQRTQKRPIPSGRLTAGEGLAFGVALTLGSFYLMVAFVNLLSALLTLAGIIYYVLLYSIFLKKTTVQNIVIGGGAGAIPPLVGWAAATGSLNIPSLFLFAIVFMWTPPHFWALAIVRHKDYARAGVPMLPVVRGLVETRKQLFIYTAELVVLTLLIPLFGLGGSIYFVFAIFLGLWLLTAAWRVWKIDGNKVAWKMYRYSSMYLAFIFAALMVDALLS